MGVTVIPAHVTARPNLFANPIGKMGDEAIPHDFFEIRCHETSIGRWPLSRNVAFWPEAGFSVEPTCAECYASPTSFPLGLMGRVGYQAYGLPPAVWKLEYLAIGAASGRISKSAGECSLDVISLRSSH